MCCEGFTLPAEEPGCDSFHFDEEAGRAAVADGASQAYESGLWASLLTSGHATGASAEPAELAGLRAPVWRRFLPVNPAPHVLRRIGQGSAATFAGLTVAGTGWRGVVVGDARLTVVTEDGLLRIGDVGDASSAPVLVTTAGVSGPVRRGAGPVCTGMVFLLATDAVARWADTENAWGDLASGQVAPLLADLRGTGRAEHDDLTLLRCVPRSPVSAGTAQVEDSGGTRQPKIG